MQLRNEGLREDGYQAIQFALDSGVLRDSPFIARNIILITDEGRTEIPLGENLTREIIEVREKQWNYLANPSQLRDNNF